MQLSDWIELTKLDVAEVAKQLSELRREREPGAADIPRATVWRHAYALRYPQPEFVRLYESLTKGAVTAADWLQLDEQKKLAAAERAEA